MFKEGAKVISVTLWHIMIASWVLFFLILGLFESLHAFLIALGMSKPYN